MSDEEKVWTAVAHLLRDQLTEAVWYSTFQDVVPLSTNGQHLTVSVPSNHVRDRIMRCLATRHPAYGWQTNVGYGTPEHLAGLASMGPTRHHRMTFAPCVQTELWGAGGIEAGC